MIASAWQGCPCLPFMPVVSYRVFAIAYGTTHHPLATLPLAGARIPSLQPGVFRLVHCQLHAEILNSGAAPDAAPCACACMTANTATAAMPTLPNDCLQPVFATIEDILLRAFPKVDCFAGREWILRLMYRTIYVAFTTVIACALPFFGAFVGLVGALTFW
jgi:Transmembrane amino acid transporter protein